MTNKCKSQGDRACSYNRERVAYWACWYCGRMKEKKDVETVAFQDVGIGDIFVPAGADSWENEWIKVGRANAIALGEGNAGSMSAGPLAQMVVVETNETPTLSTAERTHYFIDDLFTYAHLLAKDPIYESTEALFEAVGVEFYRGALTCAIEHGQQHRHLRARLKMAIRERSEGLM